MVSSDAAKLSTAHSGSFYQLREIFISLPELKVRIIQQPCHGIGFAPLLRRSADFIKSSGETEKWQEEFTIEKERATISGTSAGTVRSGLW